LGLSTVRLRSRYGKILCPGAGLLVLGFGPSASTPIRRISRRARLRFIFSVKAIRREP